MTPNKNNNLLAMLMANPQQDFAQMPSPLMSPQAKFASAAPQPIAPVAAPQMPQPVQPTQPSAARSFQPSYEQQLEDAFYKAMQERDEQTKAYKDQLAKAQKFQPSFADANLRPALAYADSLMGTNTANTYQAPTGIADNKALQEKLQESITKNQNSIADDQLNYLKMKAQEESADRREKRMIDAASNRDSKEESAIRKEYLNHPVVKGMKEVDQAASAIESNPGVGGPAQQAMVYQFSKILDPGSVVREGEYAMSAANAGAINQARNYLNRMQTGQLLTPEQIAEMKAVVKNMTGSYRSRVNDVNEYYKGLSTRKGFDSRNIIVDPYMGSQTKAGATVATNKKPEDMSLEELRLFVGE